MVLQLCCDSARQEVLHKELEDIYAKRDQNPQLVQRLVKKILETVTKIANWIDTYKGTFAITWALD
jgi:protein associated with RNAse G/E